MLTALQGGALRVDNNAIQREGEGGFNLTVTKW